MPDLEEVLSAFPDGLFLINFKSREVREADMLATLVAEHPERRSIIWGVYGGDEPTFRAAKLLGEDLAVWSRSGVVNCLGKYLAFSWTSLMPDACKNTVVMIPINAAPWFWGWPNLLLQRFRAVNSKVILSGIDSLEELNNVPDSFYDYIWTNKIEIIGPALN